MDPVSGSLIAAQNNAAALFAEVVDSGMIQAGKLESEPTAEIHSLARSRFGLRRHWHKRIVRSGLNMAYYHEPADRWITADDIDSRPRHRPRPRLPGQPSAGPHPWAAWVRDSSSGA
jgi:hypothetical protein